jgi:hypothetical protein
LHLSRWQISVPNESLATIRELQLLVLLKKLLQLNLHCLSK